MPLDRHDAGAGRARLDHELKNPLAIILGRMQLLARLLRDHPGLSAQEQARVLATAHAIEHEVQVLTARIDSVQSATYAEDEDGWDASPQANPSPRRRGASTP